MPENCAYFDIPSPHSRECANDVKRVISLALQMLSRAFCLSLCLSSAAYCGSTDLTLVTNSGSNDVSLLSLPDLARVGTISVGQDPRGIAVSPDGRRAYVANAASGTVSVLDIFGTVQLTTIPVPQGPTELALNGDGSRLYVACWGASVLAVVDTTLNSVMAQIPVPTNPEGVALSPDGSKVYVAASGSGKVYIINTASNQTIGSIATGLQPFGIVIAPSGKKAWVSDYGSNSVFILDLTQNAVSKGVAVGTVPFGVALTPDAKQVYVANSGSNSVTVLDGNSDVVLTTVPVGSQPRGLAVTRDGSTVVAGNYGSNSVSLISTATHMVQQTLGVGTSPRFGVATSPCAVISASMVGAPSTLSSGMATVTSLCSWSTAGTPSWLTPQSASPDHVLHLSVGSVVTSPNPAPAGGFDVSDAHSLTADFTLTVTGGSGSGYFSPALQMTGGSNESQMVYSALGSSAAVNWPASFQVGNPDGPAGTTPLEVTCPQLLLTSCYVPFTFGVPLPVHFQASTLARIATNHQVPSLTVAGSASLSIYQGSSAAQNLLQSSGAPLAGSVQVAFTPAANGVLSVPMGNVSSTLSYSIAANSSSLTRTGAITLGGSSLTILQAAVPCTYGLGASSSTAGAGAGTGSVMISVSPADCMWSVTSNVPWITFMTPGGTGPGPFGYTVAANTTAQQRTGILTIAGLSFTVTQSAGVDTAPPIGVIDGPADNATGLSGAVSITGWALDNTGVTSLKILRDPVGKEYPGNLIPIGNAAFAQGARPDIQASFPGYPNNDRAGWGIQILTPELPNSDGSAGTGNGTYRFHAVAYDAAGNSTELGVRTVGVDNLHAVGPFGTIDTPQPGDVISGTGYVNFGWVLTPQPQTIPVDGSTISLFIDNQLVCKTSGGALDIGCHTAGDSTYRPVYNLYRPDISMLFPGLKNSSGPIAYFTIDTTKLANGYHTIAWSVSDSGDHAQGIGSRSFIVQN